MSYLCRKKEDLCKLRGSKYVQSRIGSTYKEAESFLKQNRKVLYSGTPCQIAGLKKYLRKDYDNLFVLMLFAMGLQALAFGSLIWKLFLYARRVSLAEIRFCYP